MDPESSNIDDVFEEYYINNDYVFERLQAHHPFVAVCFSLVFCVSVPANGFLLWVLLKQRAWRTTLDLLLLQLTVSHLCFTVTLPFNVSHLLHGWTFGRFACSVSNGVSVLGLFSYIWVITALVLHHYVDVVPVSWVSTLAAKKNGFIIASIVIWLVCAALGIEASVNSGVVGHSFGEECFHIADFEVLLFDIYMQVSLLFVIPLIVMTFCCVHMLITLRQSGAYRHGQVLRLVLGEIVIFFLCLAPYHISHFLLSLAMLDVVEVMGQDLYRAHLIISAVLSLHCCLNPLLQIFGAQRIRKHLPMPCNPLYQRRDGGHDLNLMPVISANDQSV